MYAGALAATVGYVSRFQPGLGLSPNSRDFCWTPRREGKSRMETAVPAGVLQGCAVHARDRDGV